MRRINEKRKEFLSSDLVDTHSSRIEHESIRDIIQAHFSAISLIADMNEFEHLNIQKRLESMNDILPYYVDWTEKCIK